MDQPQQMNTKATTWIWKINLPLHLAWFVKLSMKAVKLMPLPWRNLTMGAKILVNIIGEHFRPNCKTCWSYNFPLHLNLRNFLIWALMGTWRKASLRSNPTHMVSCWNHFLTVLSSSIWKYTWQIYLLNFPRFRIDFHSGLLLDLGTTKYELTYFPCTWPPHRLLLSREVQWLQYREYWRH